MIKRMENYVWNYDNGNDDFENRFFIITNEKLK